MEGENTSQPTPKLSQNDNAEPAAKPYAVPRLSLTPAKEKALRSQQQRLLFFRHASRCKSEHCTVIPCCSQMKELWRHLTVCRDRNCQTPHCLSTRVVLNHYGQCQDAKCAMCEPLRAVGSKVRERDGKSV